MDASTFKALGDKAYEKRKTAALDLENRVREALAVQNWDKIGKIIDQLTISFAGSKDQHQKNGGLIGLAAASVAIGPEVARYLDDIVPAVLELFEDFDTRTRYYACESLYNIAKTSKIAILPHFGVVFDKLSKLVADTDLSTKNGAELLDRLMKDIVSDAATSYVSFTVYHREDGKEKQDIVKREDSRLEDNGVENTTLEASDTKATNHETKAFTLDLFVPTLTNHILARHANVRMFLISWVTLLDSLPDLYLVAYLPSFMEGLLEFLEDSNTDVVHATNHVFDRFLEEIRQIAKVKRDLEERKASKDKTKKTEQERPEEPATTEDVNTLAQENRQEEVDSQVDEKSDGMLIESHSDDGYGSYESQDEWLPGQDVHIEHPKILSILISNLSADSHERIRLTSLQWLDSLFDICPEDILTFAPRLLTYVLPSLSSNNSKVKQAAENVNSSLMEYVLSLPYEDSETEAKETSHSQARNTAKLTPQLRETSNLVQSDASNIAVPSTEVSPQVSSMNLPDAWNTECCQPATLDYETTISALTMHFMNENEATRIASLSWLIMLQRKAPRKVLAVHDGSFPALLKTLNDSSDTVITRDLQLLSQISKHSDDSYFTNFMINLLELFSSNRRLLEYRGNLIIRTLCTNLSPERIFRTMADCLDQEKDVEFAFTMVQTLNNNLITAPELADLRRKLRSWETRDAQTLFVTLFRAWTHNAIAAISLCLLSQAYEQAYNLLQIFGDLEMTVNMLTQIDKLVQLLESPIFTYLRLQLLEPNTYPYLYKTLYGILMLLPQSAAFAALKNRLNSVSAIGFVTLPTPTPSRPAPHSQTSTPTVTGFDRPNRLKSRDDGQPTVRWNELLEKFKQSQERLRKVRNAHIGINTEEIDSTNDTSKTRKLLPSAEIGGVDAMTASKSTGNLSSGFSSSGGANVHRGVTSSSSVGGYESVSSQHQQHPHHQTAKEHGGSSGHKSKFSASHLGRLATGVKSKGKK